ncbi:hypothetical protein Anacy_1058 [Anabaena cylindrica PCC 7122]|uniref:Uncharacterized protein n=1 Tax=Anabaena cylindrica (strain ATCC 27899 / PCC 7122) TaxID=272123 RepID=K9ZBS1_ANACC|nr:hypothetical protein Anacy_1058 [Anabaena cylindrica PCC 7122]BAY00918.1 hypothetical protein NIES19_01480 [Anabaena cylindrica PCC 7122]
MNFCLMRSYFHKQTCIIYESSIKDKLNLLKALQKYISGMAAPRVNLKKMRKLKFIKIQ